MDKLQTSEDQMLNKNVVNPKFLGGGGRAI